MRNPRGAKPLNLLGGRRWRGIAHHIAPSRGGGRGRRDQGTDRLVKDPAIAGQWQGQAGRGAGGGDPQQMLSRAPVIKIADLKKGDAVMVVSTDGATNVTAITLLAGVEPLLEAPAASQSLLNNWSMGSGAPDTGVQ